MSLKGKTIIVTGGGSGIGAVSALHFAAEGANVVVSGRRLEALQKVAAGHPNIVAVQGDAAVEADLERLKSAALKAFGRIDSVFLNAGVEGSGRPLADTSAEELAAVFRTNNVGPILGIKHFAEQVGQHGGAIVVTSSLVSAATPYSFPVDDLGAYVASKAGVDATVRAFHVPLLQRGVRLFSVNPGLYDTDMAAKVTSIKSLAAVGIKSNADFAFAFAPLGNIGHGIDVARTVAALVAGTSKYPTGHSIAVLPSLVAGEPLTSDLDSFYPSLAAQVPMTHSFSTANWKTFDGSDYSPAKLAELRAAIQKHAEIVAAASKK